MIELSVLLTGMCVLLLISFLLSEYDFFSPSFIVCLLFTFSTSLAIYATICWGVPETIFSGRATFIILSGMLVFVLSEQIVKKIVTKKKSGKYVRGTSLKKIKISTLKMIVIIVFCAAGSFLCAYAYYETVKLNGYTGGLNFKSIALFYHNLTFSAEKEGGLSKGLKLIQQAEVSIMFICAFIFTNNVIGCREKFKKNLVYLVPIACWIPNTLMTGSRSVYLQLSGAMVLTGYVSMCRRNGWKKMKQNHRKVLICSTFAFAIALLMFYVAVVNGAIGRKTNKTLIDYVTMYLGAPIIHFNQFITAPPPNVTYWGQETFSRINPVLYRLGIVKSKISSQLEMRVITGIYRGNVYTFFRRPYHDFGLLGMYLVVMITSGIFTYVYYKNIYGIQQSLKNDRVLILYSYFFYIIYLFSVLCQVCNLVYFGMAYFLVIFYIIYGFMFGQWGLKNEKQLNLFIRKTPRSRIWFRL